MIFVFSMLQLSFSRTFLMDTFKMTEYNPICKVFTEVFLRYKPTQKIKNHI